MPVFLVLFLINIKQKLMLFLGWFFDVLSFLKCSKIQFDSQNANQIKKNLHIRLESGK